MRKSGRIVNLVVLAVIASFMMVSLSSGVVFAATAKAKTAKSITVTGMLEESAGEYTIKSGKTSYVVTGQDFAAMKGKKVKATGTVTKGDKGNVLEVTKISEVKKKGK